MYSKELIAAHPRGSFGASQCIRSELATCLLYFGSLPEYSGEVVKFRRLKMYTMFKNSLAFVGAFAITFMLLMLFLA